MGVSYGFGSFDYTLEDLNYFEGVPEEILQELSADLHDGYIFLNKNGFSIFEKQIQTETIKGGGELPSEVVKEIFGISHQLFGKMRIHLPREICMGISSSYKIRSREGSVQNVVDIVNQLINCKIDSYIIHPIAPIDGKPEQWGDSLVTSVRELNLDVFGESRGVNFILETNYTERGKKGFFNEPDQILGLLERINEGVDKQRKVLLDIDVSHTETLFPIPEFSDKPTYEFLEMVKDAGLESIVGQISLSDFKHILDKDDRDYPGIAHMVIHPEKSELRGDIDWRELAPIIKKFDVPLVFQVYPRPTNGYSYFDLKSAKETFYGAILESRRNFESFADI